MKQPLFVLPVVRAHSHPASEKIQDWLLSRVEFYEEDADLLDKCLSNYELKTEETSRAANSGGA